MISTFPRNPQHDDCYDSQPEISHPKWFIFGEQVDTEINMNGILGFLENSTGAYLPDTVLAFNSIGATITASTLMRIDALMQAHGFTTAHLRQDLSNQEPFQVTTFRASHGESSSLMASAVDAEARNLYLHQRNGEPVFVLLEAYVERHRSALIEALVARGA